MKNLKYYQNEIQKIVDNLPSDIRERARYEMMIHSSPNAIDVFDLNDADLMFSLVFYKYVEELFDSPEFDDDEYFSLFEHNNALFELSEEVRLSLLDSMKEK